MTIPVLSLLAGWALAAAAQGPGPVAPVAAPRSQSRPSLVVVIVIDQLPSGTLEAIHDRLSGGFRRFMDEGRRFPQCSHEHANTETGPGHATLLSGLFPSRHGIVANEWYDRVARREVNCVADDGPAAKPNFDGSPAASPERLKEENLADLLKRSSPASRVFAAAGKDRSAILSAGHRPDGAFWFSATTGGFTSNARLVAALPAWGSEFWRSDATSSDLYRKNIPAAWTYPQRPWWGADDSPFESSAYSRVSPHPLRESSPEKKDRGDGASAVARRVFSSPWVDWLTLELAGRILQSEGLGGDDAPDLLVLGLSGADPVGHLYGPRSQEYLDALLRVDEWLGRFMSAAEKRGRILFALTSDHGVLPLPETVPGGRRVDEDAIGRRLEQALETRFGRNAGGRVIESNRGGNIHLDRRVLERLGIPLEKAIEETRREVSTYPEIARVYRGSDLAGAPAGADRYLDLYRNSHDPERGGDLVIQPCERCLFTSRQEGTSHGSPYDYDRTVPLILLGAAIRPGEDAAECRTADLAPTLADLFGLRFDSPRDGRSLVTAGRVDMTPAGK